MKKIILFLIKAYQKIISPMFGRRCRFYPTCSAYAYTAISRFGVIKGGWLALKRVVKCNPFNPGGYDPVPEKSDRNK